jgi:hypothetical protein
MGLYSALIEYQSVLGFVTFFAYAARYFSPLTSLPL